MLYISYYIFVGKYDNAEIQIRDLLSKNIDDLTRFRANYSLIVVATATKNWLQGFPVITKNSKILPYIEDITHIQNYLLTTIIFYNQLGQYSLALSYIEQFTQYDLSAIQDCWITQLSLEAKFKLNKLTLNDNAIDDGITKCVNANYTIVTNIIRIYKTKLYLQNDKPEDALNFIQQYLFEISNTKYPMLIAEMSNTIAKAYWKVGDTTKSKEFALNALDANQDLSNVLQGVDTYYILYQVAKKQGDSILALEYYEKYAEIEKANLEGEKAKHLAFQLAEHKAFEQESRIKLLNEKNTSLTVKQALAEAEVANIQLIIAMLTLCLALIILWGGRFYKAHIRIKELAEFDALTGAHNRGYFTHIATSALNYCKSAAQDISVIIFDLDHFKSVNDTYGHATGDWALIEAISVCKDLGRQNDIFARLGGEEFCILLPSCDIRTAALRAEQCRQAIENICTENSGHDFKITASFGVTDAKTSGFELEKLLADADEAAYDSKKSGRNRITVFTINEESEQKQLDSSWSIT